MADLEVLCDEVVVDHVNRPPMAIFNAKAGWGLFTEELAWFLYDFFKLKLNGFDKLIFYSYYINGFTMEEVGNCYGKTPQAVGKHIDRINKKLQKVWKTRKTWRVNNDDCHRPDKCDRSRDKD